MRTFSRVRLHRSGRGWFWFWAAALIVLPNCSFDAAGLADTNAFRGFPPRTSAIFCDIERPAGRRCATPEEIAASIRLAEAAVALVAGRTALTGLDDSPAALSRCGGQPEVVEFFGPFPEGGHECVNCGVIGPMAPHASNADFCTAVCLDLFATDDVNLPPSAEALAFCTPARARLSTNFPATGCFDNACATMGGVDPTFDDPRRHPEPVDWVNLVGVNAGGGSLQRTAPETGNYDAGASSSASQFITGGDAYFEFTAVETDRDRLAGLSSGPAPAGSLTLNDIGFALRMQAGRLAVLEFGDVVSSLGTYGPSERFRVKLRDNFDGTATVSFARLTGPCLDGSPCSEAIFHTSTTPATYPVRVDALFRTTGATVAGARIVRIR